MCMHFLSYLHAHIHATTARSHTYTHTHTHTQSKVTVWRLIAFVSPLMFVLGIQRFTRPMINLLVARFSSDKCEAARAVAVLTATYPLGHIAYGWINQVRPVPPAFQKVCYTLSPCACTHTHIPAYIRYS